MGHVLPPRGRPPRVPRRSDAAATRAVAVAAAQRPRARAAVLSRRESSQRHPARLAVQRAPRVEVATTRAGLTLLNRAPALMRQVARRVVLVPLRSFDRLSHSPALVSVLEPACVARAGVPRSAVQRAP